jgi:hypothetical protein
MGIDASSNAILNQIAFFSWKIITARDSPYQLFTPARFFILFYTITNGPEKIPGKSDLNIKHHPFSFHGHDKTIAGFLNQNR